MRCVARLEGRGRGSVCARVCVRAGACRGYCLQEEVRKHEARLELHELEHCHVPSHRPKGHALKPVGMARPGQRRLPRAHESGQRQPRPNVLCMRSQLNGREPRCAYTYVRVCMYVCMLEAASRTCATKYRAVSSSVRTRASQRLPYGEWRNAHETTLRRTAGKLGNASCSGRDRGWTTSVGQCRSMAAGAI
jgi:hypothetical protein